MRILLTLFITIDFMMLVTVHLSPLESGNSSFDTYIFFMSRYIVFVMKRISLQVQQLALLLAHQWFIQVIHISSSP